MILKVFTRLGARRVFPLVVLFIPLLAQAAEEPKATNQLATVGGGCFWCTEALFETVEGVSNVISGYAGGSTPSPTYKQICTGLTGHAEVIQIEFDPKRISYQKILELFWKAHDPTTLNRQGADEGPQYRSIILYHSPEQKKIAEDSKTAAQARLSKPITTEIAPLKEFYPAEDYHQDYFKKNPNAGYCRIVIQPKLKKFSIQTAVPEK